MGQGSMHIVSAKEVALLLRFIDEEMSIEERILTENEESVEELTALFIKKYKGREEPFFWTLPGSGIANGLVPVQQWSENFKQAYKSPNPLVRYEAVEQLRQKVRT